MYKGLLFIVYKFTVCRFEDGDLTPTPSSRGEGVTLLRIDDLRVGYLFVKG